MPTIREAVEAYLNVVAASRSPRTARSYRSGLDHFLIALKAEAFDPDTQDVNTLDEGRITTFIKHVSPMSPASQALYLTAVRGFYQYLASEQLADPNLPRLQELVRRRSRQQRHRIPQFPREEIEQLIVYADLLIKKDADDPVNGNEQITTRSQSRSDRQRNRLRNLRDRALILFLADTGLRISEACSLTLGDVDFYEARLNVIGKGDQQALVRISQRALSALQDYLSERNAAYSAAKQNPGTAVQKTKSRPLFTRHDRGANLRDLRPLNTSSAWDIIKNRAREAVGDLAASQIHPHSFRHYFVTVVLLATNNLEKTRRLARHKSITVTQRYAEIDPELDQDYYEIFDSKEKQGFKRNTNKKYNG